MDRRRLLGGALAGALLAVAPLCGTPTKVLSRGEVLGALNVAVGRWVEDEMATFDLGLYMALHSRPLPGLEYPPSPLEALDLD